MKFYIKECICICICLSNTEAKFKVVRKEKYKTRFSQKEEEQ